MIGGFRWNRTRQVSTDTYASPATWQRDTATAVKQLHGPGERLVSVYFISCARYFSDLGKAKVIRISRYTLYRTIRVGIHSAPKLLICAFVQGYGFHFKIHVRVDVNKMGIPSISGCRSNHADVPRFLNCNSFRSPYLPLVCRFILTQLIGLLLKCTQFVFQVKSNFCNFRRTCCLKAFPDYVRNRLCGQRRVGCWKRQRVTQILFNIWAKASILTLSLSDLSGKNRSMYRLARFNTISGGPAFRSLVWAFRQRWSACHRTT